MSGRNNFFDNIDGNIEVVKEVVLNGNNETKIGNLFQLYGPVEMREVYLEITEGSITNMTGIRFTLYDGTLDLDITADGAVLSGSGVGSLLIKDKDKAEVANVLVNSQGRVFESVSSKDTYQSFFLNQKLSVNTFIRLHYTTTETPMNAKLKVFIKYRQTNGGFLEAVA